LSRETSENTRSTDHLSPPNKLWTINSTLWHQVILLFAIILIDFCIPQASLSQCRPVN